MKHALAGLLLRPLWRLSRKLNWPERDIPEVSTQGAHHVGDAANEILRRGVGGAKPYAIARFGYVELESVVMCHELASDRGLFSKLSDYIADRSGVFWWDERVRRHMHRNAGFFPADREHLSRFYHQTLDDVRDLDVLGSWLRKEDRLNDLLSHVAKVPVEHVMMPFKLQSPWTAALEGQRVLVIHPFGKSIQRQYAKRGLLFNNKRVLPEFDLITINAVQSSAHNSVKFKTWFDALDHMLQQAAAIEFDTALIGAGAYGLSLAAGIKRLGKKAVHMGSGVQLLFGIRGKRWDNSGYHNEHWSRPLPEETPQRCHSVEGGCYW